MSYSQSLLSKKGLLGTIWVAGYSLKRLSKDQIAQSDIPSSVDKILIDEWPSVPYRILAYLLLGVVRVYSKKVEYVLDDCRRIINELHKFMDKKKATSFREIVGPQDFSVSLPESYELDAFVLELADDANKSHVAQKEDITLQDSFTKEKSAKYVINKYRRDVTLQQTTTSTTYKATPSTTEREAGPSARNPPEPAVEMETCSTSSFVHVEKIISSIYLEIHAETSSSDYIRSVETSSIEELREIRFSREECQDFERFYQNDEDRLDIFGSSSIIQSPGFEHSDLIRMMQKEANDLFRADAGDVIQTVEVNPDLHTPSGDDDHIAPQEKEANFCIKVPPNEHNHFAAEVEVNSSDAPLYPEMASNNYENVVVAAMGEEPPTLGRNGFKNSHQSDGYSSAVPRKEKPTLTVQITPDSKNPSAKGPAHSSSMDFLAVRTPAKREYTRRASKRKCAYDDPMVISNEELKDSIDDASGLVRKRRKVPHASLAIWRLSHIYNLPQKFMEPLIPCVVIDPSNIERVFKNANEVETVQTSDKQVMATSPRSVTDCRLTIAPGTPVLCPASTRAFKNPKAADSDGEVTFLSFGSTSRADLSHSYGNARNDFAAASDEEFDMDPMDKEMDQNEDGQESDGWSSRTRAVARWLHKIFKTKTESKEARTTDLSGMLVGKTRKESARVFYEILVLGSKGFVDVTQKGSYGDILVQETKRTEGKLACV